MEDETRELEKKLLAVWVEKGACPNVYTHQEGDNLVVYGLTSNYLFYITPTQIRARRDRVEHLMSTIEYLADKEGLELVLVSKKKAFNNTKSVKYWPWKREFDDDWVFETKVKEFSTDNEDYTNMEPVYRLRPEFITANWFSPYTLDEEMDLID